MNKPMAWKQLRDFPKLRRNRSKFKLESLYIAGSAKYREQGVGSNWDAQNNEDWVTWFRGTKVFA